MVDEAPTEDTQTESNPMTTTMPKKKKRAKKRDKAPETRHTVSAKAKRKAKRATNGVHKSKRNGKPELTERGLPVRPKYDDQIGIRVNAEERAELVRRCQEDGQFSLSNLIRVALKFPPLR